jgi:predicted nuclease with TOPRIM domain
MTSTTTTRAAALPAPPATDDPRRAELREEIRSAKGKFEEASAEVTSLLREIRALPFDSPERAAKEKDLAEWKEREATLERQLDKLKQDLKDLDAKLQALEAALAPPGTPIPN